MGTIGGGAGANGARIAVMGAGLIGRRHVEQAVREAQLAAIIDPAPEAAELARACGVPHFATLADLLADGRRGDVDGVVIATPNQLHVEHGLACAEARLPMLVEKPIADDVGAATRLVEAAEAAGVPILVGHHRRHNPLIKKAREEIGAGLLGRIVAVHATCWFYKPDYYFKADWRRQPGAGPVFLNLIHDIDLMRHLAGEVVAVQAADSAAARDFAVEDSAAIILHFASGALGTVTVSDTIVAPWSWELTSVENPAYPRSGEACYLIGGTRGSLSLPTGELWSQPGAPDWWQPLERRTPLFAADDPLALQMRHFADVALGNAEPLVSGREGLATLKVIDAVKRAAAGGGLVRPG